MLSVKDILTENRRRHKEREVSYNPYTGVGAPGERVLLEIPDFAIKRQFVPKEMLNNILVQSIIKYGSIAEFLKHNSNPDYAELTTAHDVELTLRRIRHKYDFLFWAYCCILIKPKQRKKGTPSKIPFYLNYPQLLLFQQCERMRLANEPIDVIILKARQWGGSTFCIFYQFWLTMKWDNSRNFTVVAHVQSASETIFGMINNTIASYPGWDLGLKVGEHVHIAPEGKSGHAFSIKDANGAKVIDGLVYIGTAEKPDALRSKDISGAHYSEVGIWPDTPKKRAEDIIADIHGGLLEENPYTMQVIESTAKNSDDYFHSTWMECIQGHGGYYPLFIPWYYVPHDSRPIPEDKLEEFAKWLLDNKDNVNRDREWKDNGKHYWWLWQLGATLEGINWYRYKRLKQLSYSQMQNEAPSTWEEAFVAAGKKVFDTYEVAEMRKRCRPCKWTGDLISDGKSGPEVLDNIKFVENQTGNLQIWEMPDQESAVSNRYLVSVDIGGPNITSDYTSIRVLDKLMMMEDYGGVPSVVAEMHYHSPHHKLVYDAVRLAKWYRNATLIIESNTLETSNPERDTGGDGSQYILDEAASIYPYLYTRDSPAEDITEKKPTKYGFHTNSRTKPQIIDFLVRCVSEQLWIEPSALCMDEIAIYREESGVYTAPPKKHDDVLMATAILLWVAYRDSPRPAWIKEEHTYRGPLTVAHF